MSVVAQVAAIGADIVTVAMDVARVVADVAYIRSAVAAIGADIAHVVAGVTAIPAQLCDVALALVLANLAVVGTQVAVVRADVTRVLPDVARILMRIADVAAYVSSVGAKVTPVPPPVLARAGSPVLSICGVSHRALRSRNCRHSEHHRDAKCRQSCANHMSSTSSWCRSRAPCTRSTEMDVGRRLSLSPGFARERLPASGEWAEKCYR